MPAPDRRIDQRDVQEYLRRVEKLSTELAELRGSVARSVAPVEVTAENAQTTAASKTVVLRTIDAPSGDDAAPQNLWLPPGSNTPHALDQDSGEWLPIPDKTATDAAAAAADAAILARDVQGDLAEATAALEAADGSIRDSFGQRIDGLSTDVDTALTRAGDAASAASTAQSSADQAKQDAAAANRLASTAKTAADTANSAALAASGLAASKGEVIVQVSAPTGSRAISANLWIDSTLDANGKPKNTPNRYGPFTVPDPNVVTRILAASSAQTESEVMRVAVAPNATTPVALTLSVSMALNGYVKSSTARLRDGASGAVLASYTFTDKGDSTGGNAETWTLPAGFTATPSSAALVVTIQSSNANSPDVFSLHRTITASNWQTVTDQKVIDAAAAAAAAQSSATSAGQAAAAADTKAVAAQSAANAAQTTANNAGQAAAAAQTTADTAKTNAATAQSAADSAKAAADTAAAKAVAIAGGVLANGGAEFDFDSWDSSSKGTIAVQTTKVRSGSKAWQANANGEIRQGMFPVKPGDTWRYRWWAQAVNTGSGSVNGGLRLQKYDANASSPAWSDAGSSTAPTVSAFTMQEVTYTVPSSGVTHLRARIAFANAAGVTVYFDDIELVNITDATAAAQAAATASSAASTAQSTADTAKANAATAQSAADAAKAAASAAQSTADQAKSAAATAQTAADNANSQALSAAGIANGKGRVIYQASAPTGANANAQNLWIRTTDNTPWTYDATNTKWVQVTDQTAKDAAAAAATAQQAATAASNAAAAAQATADGRPQILFSSTSGPSGTAPTGTIWFLWDSSKNVAGQWLQSGTLASPVWTSQQIRSEVIANLDVAKLTAGSAAVASVVAQKIAAATANFQTANVSNLFVTSGATLSQAVIDFLFANVVQAKKITAGMIDVDSLSGITLTGTTVQTAASGKRAVLGGNLVKFYDASENQAGQIEGLSNGAAGGILRIGPSADGSAGMYVGTWSLPVGTAAGYVPSFYVNTMTVDDLFLAATGSSLLVPSAITSALPANWGASANGSNTVTSWSFSSAVSRPVRIKYGSIIDPGGGNLGGSWSLRLNGVQLGVAEGLATPGPTKGSWWQQLNKPGRLFAGTNTIQLIVSKESGSATIYGNRNTIEVEG